jgi:hypothetical protein
MSFPVTLNGTTYTLADFSGTSYVDGFPAALEDFVTHAGAIYSTTSTTSNVIGTGSKTFTVEASKPYQVGTPLRIADTAAVTTNWIDAIVTSYSGTSLVVTAVAYAGSGTKTAWSINIGGGPVAYTGTLPVAQGGTGATSATAAASNLGVGTEDSPTFSDATLLTSDGGVLNLQTSEATIVDGDVLGALKFNAPSEADGADGDARLVGAEIAAVAEGTFSDTNNATELVFKTGASASADVKMILDSSGNVLVGKTADDVTVVGTQINNDGFIGVTRNGNIPALFDRTTSDGDIVSLRKNGSTVGSIGTNAGYLYIGSPVDTDAFIGMGGGQVYPATSVGDYRDNAIDLGGTTRRFKDLYLSGGVFLGGTGSANLLQDYESGTFTPTSPTVSFSASTGSYTKIGRQVFYEIDVTLPSTSSGVQFLIDGMPFSNASKGGAFIKYTTNGTVITFNNNAGTRVSAFNLDSNITTLASVSGKRFSIVGQYFVA